MAITSRSEDMNEATMYHGREAAQNQTLAVQIERVSTRFGCSRNWFFGTARVSVCKATHRTITPEKSFVIVRDIARTRTGPLRGAG